MNKADSLRLSSFLDSWGFTPSPQKEADIIIVNTCVVRQKAEDKAISYLNYLKPIKKLHPQTKIILTGCLVDSRIGLLKNRFPHVDLCFRPQHFDDFLSWSRENNIFTSQADYLPRHPPVSVYVPVIYGCNYRCAYCIVPFRRGKEVSRPIPEVVSEVKELVKRGTKEVTLVGQNVNSYGKDLPQKADLADLLIELDEVCGLYRIRFLTSHPRDITERFITTVARLNKVCPQFNLPVQSGDNQILGLMRRGYRAEDYLKLVRQIKEIIPHASISTDIIVGFPEETKEAFQNTCRLIEEVKPDITHVAIYSPRPGTWAARHLSDNIPHQEKRLRWQQVENLQREIALQINLCHQNQEAEVLMENRQDGKWFGRTKEGKIVFLEEERDIKGRLVLVKIEKVTPFWLGGRLVKCLE